MKKILIIEDEKDISKMYQTSLQNDGYEVVLAGNGEEGLKSALESKPNLILLDIIIPKMDGFSTLEQLKKEKVTKNIPVIMLTNLGQDEDKEKGKKLGAVDYFVKANFTPMQISAKIKKYLK